MTDRLSAHRETSHTRTTDNSSASFTTTIAAPICSASLTGHTPHLPITDPRHGGQKKMGRMHVIRNSVRRADGQACCQVGSDDGDRADEQTAGGMRPQTHRLTSSVNRFRVMKAVVSPVALKSVRLPANDVVEA